ncbi:hypothetical protein NONI108955_00265 [Nocardia ninae]|uniref:Uncharacterized protein n=1 Tax=Nocardia ninae NBRC 108245 TaxID=1210091 RepID=A0A511MMQ5_9NOCA|nr:hypothetical protein [Nocardia ninae]GEM41196.1 hypothetical protein NN4_57150 [Nocardia ninae NBRC 108245]
MSYPQYPGGYNPYPAYSAGVPAPSGATAVTAGVLACVGSIGQLLGGGISLAFGFIGWQLQDYDTSGLFSQDWFQTWAIVSGVLSLVIAVVLGVGAVAMFSRKSFGRLLVVVGCVTVVVAEIVGFALVSSIDGSSDGLGVISGSAGSLIGLIFPVATAILALLPPTSRWLAHSPAAAIPQQYGYPYPGPPWQQAAPTGISDQTWHQPPAPQAAWDSPAQPPAHSASADPTDQVTTPSPQPVRGVPAQSGGAVPDEKVAEEPSAPQVGWNLSAQPPAPSGQGGWVPAAPPASGSGPAQSGAMPQRGQAESSPPEPQAARGAPTRTPSGAAAGPRPEPQAASSAPAETPSGQEARPQPAPDDETVRQPPSSEPQKAEDDGVRRPPPS